MASRSLCLRRQREGIPAVEAVGTRMKMPIFFNDGELRQAIRRRPGCRR